MIRRLASLPWLRPRTVRQLRRYYQGAMTSCRPSRRTSLPSFGGTIFCTLVLLPLVRRAAPRAGGFRSSLRLPPAGFKWRRQDLSRSQGTPIVPMPCSTTPVGPDTPTRPSRCTDTAPARTTTRAPAIATFGAQSHGLSTRCLRFAGWITPPPRKTRFRLLARHFRTGFYPQGSFERFQSRLHLILLS